MTREQDTEERIATALESRAEPATASWDDLAYEVYVRQSLEAGLADANAGRTVTTDDALNRVRARIRRAS